MTKEAIKELLIQHWGTKKDVVNAIWEQYQADIVDLQKTGDGFLEERNEALRDLNKCFHFIDILLDGLKQIAEPTYGIKFCNTDAENNEILANHFFIHQRIARETLKKFNEEFK